MNTLRDQQNKQSEWVQRVAAGLRNMEYLPDAFLFCGESDLVYYKSEIAGIEVFHSSMVYNTMPSDTVEFIPIWRDEEDYTSERRRFNDGYLDMYSDIAEFDPTLRRGAE